MEQKAPFSNYMSLVARLRSLSGHLTMSPDELKKGAMRLKNELFGGGVVLKSEKGLTGLFDRTWP